MVKRQAAIALQRSRNLFIALVALAGCQACVSPGLRVPAPTSSTEDGTPTVLTTSPPLLPFPSSTTCSAQTGEVMSNDLDTGLLPRPLRYRIYLPPCYSEEINKRYPVLYLLHGQTYNEAQWVDLGAPTIADLLITQGEVSPFIMVMPYDPSWMQPQDDPFGQALIEALVPYIDQQYSTISDRGFRAIGGLSRGGGWAIHLGLQHWDIFGAIGAHSPAIFWNDANDLDGWLAAIPSASLLRIYLDIGENDRELRNALWFEDKLNLVDLPHEWHLNIGDHNEAYWEAHVGEYLRWYGAGWSTLP